MNVRMSACTLVTALALLGSAPTASAGEYDLSIFGGLSMPSGDFEDIGAESGPHFGVDLHYHLSPAFALGADLSWMRNKHEDEGTTEDLGAGITRTWEKDRFNTIHYGLHGKYFFSTEGSIDPWLVLGLGFYSVNNDYEYTLDDGLTAPTTFTDEDDERDGFFEQPGTRFGYKIGGGITHMTSPKVGIGIGLEYNSISMDEDEQFGISSAPFLSLQGRITFRLGD